MVPYFPPTQRKQMGAVKALYTQIEGILQGESFGPPTYIVITGRSPNHELVAVATDRVIRLSVAGLLNGNVDDVTILEFVDGSAVLQYRGVTVQDYTLLKVE